MNDLFNSLSQMQAMDVFFVLVLAAIFAYSIIRLIVEVVKAWYENAPKSFGLFFIVIGGCAFWYGIIELFLK